MNHWNSGSGCVIFVFYEIETQGHPEDLFKLIPEKSSFYNKHNSDHIVKLVYSCWLKGCHLLACMTLSFQQWIKNNKNRVTRENVILFEMSPEVYSYAFHNDCSCDVMLIIMWYWFSFSFVKNWYLNWMKVQDLGVSSKRFLNSQWS